MTRKARFAIVFASALIPVLIGLEGCTFDQVKAPRIENMVYIPSDTIEQQGGTQTVIGMFNIVSPKPDTASIKTVVYDEQGKKINESTLAIGEKELQTAGTLAFGLDLGTSAKGLYLFQVSTLDSKGRASNPLTGAVTVRELF